MPGYQDEPRDSSSLRFAPLMHPGDDVRSTDLRALGISHCFAELIWSGREDLNRRPLPLEGLCYPG
jgi:hypothetical protein